MMKAFKKPLPAPRLSQEIPSNSEDLPPVLPARPKRGKYNTLDANTSNPSSESNPSLTDLRDFAIRKDFAIAEFDKAINRTTLPVNTDYFLSQLIAVRAEGAAESTRGTTVPTALTRCKEISDNLRNIVIDGSNIAISHGNGKVFSSRGILIAVDWFKQRGHTLIKVFVPAHRKEPTPENRDVDILHELAAQRILIFTPSRERNNGTRVTCYDDRFILRCASEDKAIVVSNDQYRDLIGEDQAFRETISQRLLMYTFVDDRFIPAEDPMGKKGCTLDQLLRINAMDTKTGNCPYGRKCTYGSKCRYHHPERQGSAILDDTPAKVRQREQKMQEFVHLAMQNNNTIKPILNPSGLIHQMATRPTATDPFTDFSNHPSNLSTMPVLISRCLREPSPHGEHKPRTAENKVVGPQRIVLKKDDGSMYPRLNSPLIPATNNGTSQMSTMYSVAAQPMHQQTFPQNINSHRKMGNTQGMTNHSNFNHLEAMSNLSLGANQIASNHNTNLSSNHNTNLSSNHSTNLSNRTNADDQSNRTNVGVEDHGIGKESELRNKMYFHLINLFPEHKVKEAMCQLPNETYPPKIIEAILKL